MTGSLRNTAALGCHASEGWHPDQIIGWMPAFAGMTRVKF